MRLHETGFAAGTRNNTFVATIISTVFVQKFHQFLFPLIPVDAIVFVFPNPAGLADAQKSMGGIITNSLAASAFNAVGGTVGDFLRLF